MTRLVGKDSGQLTQRVPQPGVPASEPGEPTAGQFGSLSTKEVERARRIFDATSPDLTDEQRISHVKSVLRMIAGVVAFLALAAPASADSGSVVLGGGGGSAPLMGSSCSGWAIGYCIERGKLVPCRCAKVNVCGSIVWMWVPASVPPA